MPDLVWYRQPVPGGYGYGRFVPALAHHETGKRRCVDIVLRDGTIHRVFVKVENLSPRQPYEPIPQEDTPR